MTHSALETASSRVYACVRVCVHVHTGAQASPGSPGSRRTSSTENRRLGMWVSSSELRGCHFFTDHLLLAGGPASFHGDIGSNNSPGILQRPLG